MALVEVRELTKIYPLGASLFTPPSSPGQTPASKGEARAVDGYKDALIAAHDDDTVISRGFTGKTLRAIRNDWTSYIEEHPEELRPFPEQMARAVAANALHLGGDDETPVDPKKECYPSGQGVGAIDELVPAGELVHRIVDEAEHALARAAAAVVR